MYFYPAIIKRAGPDEVGYTVTFPDVPEAITEGDTLEEAIVQARDALETGLSFYVDENQDLPKASVCRAGQTMIRPSLNAALKLAVYEAMRHGNVRKRDLGRRLKLHDAQIERILDLEHDTKTDQMERALDAVGATWRIVFSEGGGRDEIPATINWFSCNAEALSSLPGHGWVISKSASGFDEDSIPCRIYTPGHVGMRGSRTGQFVDADTNMIGLPKGTSRSRNKQV